ncbi:PEP-CTERM sorting domain-containing protein [Oceaniferula spumae]
MKFTTRIISLTLTVAFTASSHAAVSILLTGDTANSDGGFFPGTGSGDPNRVNVTLNDGFSYNPNNPTSPLPVQSYSQTPANGFHANKTSGTHTLSYILTNGAIGSPTVYFDFYGRNNNTNRDNNYTVSLYNGDYTAGSLVAQQTGQGVPNSAPFFNRTTFNSATAFVFDRVQITAPAGTSDANRNFTVMEVRLAVPEPSSTALLGLGGLALMLRRRR